MISEPSPAPSVSPVPPAPDAASFGLTPERLAFFRSDPGAGALALFILTWGGLFYLLLGTPWGQWVMDGPRDEPRWLVAVFLFPIPGMLTAYLLQWVRERLWGWRRTRQRHWLAYQR